MITIDKETHEDVERKVLKKVVYTDVNTWSWGNVSKDNRERITQFLVHRTLEVAESVFQNIVVKGFYSKEEEKHRQALRSEIRSELEKERRDETPTDVERERLRNYAAEIEIHCRAHAVAAWERADAAIKRIRHWPAWFIVTAILAATVVFVIHFMNFAHAYWGLGIVPLVAIVTAFGMQASKNDDIKKIVHSLEKFSSDYDALAATARRYRILDADTIETRRKLEDLVTTLDSRRSRLDEEFRTEPVRVQALKTRFRVEALTEDPLEADLQEFDKELVRAQKARTD